MTNFTKQCLVILWKREGKVKVINNLSLGSWLAQSVEQVTLDLEAVSSRPTLVQRLLKNIILKTKQTNSSLRNPKTNTHKLER